MDALAAALLQDHRVAATAGVATQWSPKLGAKVANAMNVTETLKICSDIDECSTGEHCKKENELCLNTPG